MTVLWYVFGAGFFASALLLALFQPEFPPAARCGGGAALRGLGPQAARAIRYAVANPDVGRVILGCVFVVLVTAGDDGWQPLLVGLSLPEYKLGHLYSVQAALCVAAPFSARFLVRRGIATAANVVLGMKTALLLSLLLVERPFYLGAAAVFVAVRALDAIEEPLLETFIHERIPSELRATIVSARSMAVGLLGAGGSLLAGLSMDVWGPRSVLAGCAVFGVLGSLTFRTVREPDSAQQPAEAL